MHFHPLFSLFIIPVFMLAALLCLPYLNYQRNTAGVWFGSATGRQSALIAAVAAFVLTLAGVLASEYLIDFTGWMPGIPAFISGGLIPFGLIFAVSIAFYVLIKKKFSAANNDAIQAVFMFFLIAFLLLTLIGVWFRGPEMKLMWPWQVKP